MVLFEPARAARLTCGRFFSRRQYFNQVADLVVDFGGIGDRLGNFIAKQFPVPEPHPMDDGSHRTQAQAERGVSRSFSLPQRRRGPGRRQLLPLSQPPAVALSLAVTPQAGEPHR